MAANTGGTANKRNRDKARAGEMKRLGIERTTGRCPQCYQMITVDSSKSKYTHICR